MRLRRGDWVQKTTTTTKKNVSNMEAKGEMGNTRRRSGCPSCVYVLVNRRCGRPCQCREAKSWKKKKKKKKEKKLKNKKKKKTPIDLKILEKKMRLFCEVWNPWIWKEKEKKKEQKTKKWYLSRSHWKCFTFLRVALKRRCKDAFFWVNSCIAKDNFSSPPPSFFFFPLQTKRWML